MPMSAALIGGCVVDPVAGHGHDLALLAEGLDHQHLVLGGHASDHADVVDAIETLGLGHRGQVGAEDGLPGDAQLLGDGRTGDHVVSGDHPHADVGVLGGSDRVEGLGPGRIDHPDQRGQLQALDHGQQVTVGVEVLGVDVLHGRGHDAQALAAEAIHLLVGPLVLLLAPGDGLALGQGGRGPPDHGGGGTLDEDPNDGVPRLVLGVAEGGHELVGGIERQGRKPGVGLLRAFDVELRLVPEDQQRALGGVSHDLAVDELGVVGDQERQDRRLDRVRVAGGVVDLAVEAVAHPGDRIPVRGVDHLDDGDLVHRQRAGLVRVDRRRRAQGLHRVEALHHGAVRSEIPGPAGQDDLQHRRHGHGHRCQRQRDGRREDGLGRLPAGDPEGEHDRDGQPGGRRDPQRQRVQLLGQRGLQVGADFSIPEMVPTAVSAPVPVTIITPLPCVTGVFMNAMFDWSPRTGFGSVITSVLFEAGTLSPVSADSSICREVASISRPSAHTSSPAASRTTSPTTTWSASTLTSVPSRRTRAVVLSIDCRAFMALSALPCWRNPPSALSAVINSTATPVAISPITNRGDRRPDEDDLHVGPVLGQEQLPPRRRLLGRKRVRPVGLQQLGGLRRGETAGGVDPELLGDLVRRERVPPLGFAPGAGRSLTLA